MKDETLIVIVLFGVLGICFLGFLYAKSGASATLSLRELQRYGVKV